MTTAHRDVGLLVLAGAVGHVLLVLAIEGLSNWILPTEREGAESHWFAVNALPWLYLARSLIPGFVVGLLSKRFPLGAGFLAVLIGQIVIGATNMAWDPFYPYAPFILLEGALWHAPYGLVSAAAGFHLRRHAFQPAVAADGDALRAPRR